MTRASLKADTLWRGEFGGKFNRMRDAEIADLYGDGTPADRGGHPRPRRRRRASTERESVEGRSESTRSPTRSCTRSRSAISTGTACSKCTQRRANPTSSTQRRSTARWFATCPKKKEGRTIVADLGNRHAKEIYVGDVDGDGTDELYVAVEALTTGSGGSSLEIVEPVEIRRYDADTAPDAKVVIATIPDRLSRFFTVGDVDGDGKKEMVVASFSKGLWLLRPGKDPKSEWGIESIDRDSGGFEHAALLADLDERRNRRALRGGGRTGRASPLHVAARPAEARGHPETRDPALPNDLEHHAGARRGTGSLIQRSCSRGISSAKLQGLYRMSSWYRRIPSQASLQAPVEPGSAKR